MTTNSLKHSSSPSALVRESPGSAGGERAVRRVGWLWAGVVIVGLVAIAVVAWRPNDLLLDVGAPGDRLFLGGVHGDERADGRSYRWTRGSATVDVPGVGGASRLRVVLRGEGGRPDGRAVPVAISIDGSPATELLIGPSASQVLDLERADPTRDTTTIEFRSPTFRPAGDARDLGFILDYIDIRSSIDVGSASAMFSRYVRLIAVGALLVALLWPLQRWGVPLAVIVGGGALAVVGLAAVVRPWLLAAWPWLFAGLVSAATLTHWPAISATLRRHQHVLARPWFAPAALALLVVSYSVLLTVLGSQIAWIGHADYADNAVVARNVVRGAGYSVDYAAQFYTDYGSAIRHPSDVWPLLQPTLIAAAFALFGPTTFAAKLPNIVAMSGLLLATGLVGRWLFGWPAGLGAAALLATDGWFFQNTLFPVNDVPFTLLILLLVTIAALVGGAAPALRGDEATGSSNRTGWLYIALGACAGLVVVAKPSGLLLVLGLGGWLAWQLWRKPRLRPPWRWAFAAVGIMVVLVAPLVARNLVTFGAPFYSLQSFDAWVTKWEPPDENIYRLMLDELPHPRRLVGFGLDQVSDAIALQFRRLGTDIASGNLFELPLLTLAAIGTLFGGAAVRRTLRALLAATAPYALFILVYWHYEERYVVFLIPWLSILAAGGAVGLLRLAFASGDRNRRNLAVALLVVGVAFVAYPRIDSIVNQTAKLLPPAGDVVIGEWLAANTPPDAVIMTRVPWQTSWHSDRRTVMIPLAPAEGIAATIRRYGVEYLVINRLEVPSRRREALAPLYDGRDAQGFTKVRDFANPQGQAYATLYRVPANLMGTQR